MPRKKLYIGGSLKKILPVAHSDELGWACPQSNRFQSGEGGTNRLAKMLHNLDSEELFKTKSGIEDSTMSSD